MNLRKALSFRFQVALSASVNIDLFLPGTELSPKNSGNATCFSEKLCYIECRWIFAKRLRRIGAGNFFVGIQLAKTNKDKKYEGEL